MKNITLTLTLLVVFYKCNIFGPQGTCASFTLVRRHNALCNGLLDACQIAAFVQKQLAWLSS